MKLSIITEDSDIQYDNPAGNFTFRDKKYSYWGNPIGRNKTLEYSVGKFNRYVKLGVKADELIETFKKNIEKDPKSLSGRCSYASLIMMLYGIRVGNEDSAAGYESGLEDNKGEIVQTYGTTTLLNKHITIKDNLLNLRFLGKTQVNQDINIDDKFIVRYAKVYYNSSDEESKWLGIDYESLFKFIKREVGDGFIPKDLRTFCANVTAWDTIQSYLDQPKIDTKTEANQEIKEVVEAVSTRLGNTPSIAKRNYIDGRMLDWFKASRLK